MLWVDLSQVFKKSVEDMTLLGFRKRDSVDLGKIHFSLEVWLGDNTLSYIYEACRMPWVRCLASKEMKGEGGGGRERSAFLWGILMLVWVKVTVTRLLLKC